MYPLKKKGRLPICPSVMLKLYLYGYGGGVRMRSLRRLEAESKRNVELMVADRRDEPKPYEHCKIPQ